MDLCCVALGGAEFGFGHIRRCLAIAETAKSRNLSSFFFVLGSGAELIRSRGFSAEEIRLSRNIRLPNIASTLHFRSIILDLSHPALINNREFIAPIFQRFRDRTKFLAAIDGLGELTLLSAGYDFYLDLLLIPYFYDFDVDSALTRIVYGEKYTLLGDEYRYLPARRIKKIARNVLISAGGSDPNGLTVKMLRAVNLVALKLNIHVVIGPLFSQDLVEEIEAAVEASVHNMTTIRWPQTLVDEMLWCDIAVTTSGLIKYELLATGTPSVLVSIDDYHEKANKSFATKGIFECLGVAPEDDQLADSIILLLTDYPARREVSRIGQSLVDGAGVDRLLGLLVAGGKGVR